MAKHRACRKYQITCNNPSDHGFSHKEIKNKLQNWPSVKYWCLCDEIGENGTHHTHVFIMFNNAVMFDTIHTRFYGCHIEEAQGSVQENRDYIRKEGRWLNDKKKETNLIDTFEESGPVPEEKTKKESQSEAIVSCIKEGLSNAEIIDSFPSAYKSIHHLDLVRQTFQAEHYKNTFRNITCTYIYGETRTGKTRFVMELYGYTNVYRVTDYAHPFDNYDGQPVLFFDEFRSSLPIADMLKYLDGYPLILPARYSNRVACYEKVYIVSNIPLKKQYEECQRYEPETFRAFEKRINSNFHFEKEESQGDVIESK